MSCDALPASVVVASRDRPGMLADTIASILAGDRLPRQIVIVDQSASPHPTLSSIQGPEGCHFTYLWARVSGLSAANNLGLEAARNDIVVFTHDDVLVEKEWLRVIVGAVESSLAGVVSGRVLPVVDPARRDGFAPSTITSTVPAVHRGRIANDVLYPMNMATRRATLEEVGRFDERLGPGTPYPAAEDNDLGHRLLEAGFAITYEPRATVHHRAWRDASRQASLAYAYGKGQGAFYAKHLSWSDRYMLRRVATDVARNVRQLARSLRCRPSCRSRMSEIAYLGGVASGLASWATVHRMCR